MVSPDPLVITSIEAQNPNIRRPNHAPVWPSADRKALEKNSEASERDGLTAQRELVTLDFNSVGQDRDNGIRPFWRRNRFPPDNRLSIRGARVCCTRS